MALAATRRGQGRAPTPLLLSIQGGLMNEIGIIYAYIHTLYQKEQSITKLFFVYTKIKFNSLNTRDVREIK